MATKTQLKTAACTSSVPAVLSPTGKRIEVGEVVEYQKIIFRNGENHLVLPGRKQVPAVFFHIKD